MASIGEGNEGSSSSDSFCTRSSESSIELRNFRREWAKELENHPRHLPCGSPPVEFSGGSYVATCEESDDEVKPDILMKAEELFEKAVELERIGSLYEAIQFYRKAMNLVPDIEFRVHRRNLLERNDARDQLTPSDNMSDFSDTEEMDDDAEDLVTKICNILGPNHSICFPNYSQEAVHMSCLPPEMFENILCWIVGQDLDLYTLEKISEVCRGFYIAARNPDIWKKACYRIWREETGSYNLYGSWRRMFVEKPHPRYNGCYLSRTSYFRSGENSFQDQNYQPWHIVHYYRGMRFLADGRVLFITTSEEPHILINYLGTKEVRHPQVLIGQYRILDDLLCLRFIKKSKKDCKLRGRRVVSGGTTDIAESLFKLEFDILPVKSYCNWQLQWKIYTIQSRYYNGSPVTNTMDVSDRNNFPPLLFSRVKSYSLCSNYPLV